MAPQQRKITLYLDTVSPFAYIAFYVLRNDPVFRDCHITYVPIFLGGLMHACGNTAPIQIKNKDKWIEQERRRWAELFRIPISPSTPKDFPPFTLGIMRQLAALEIADSSKPDQTRLIKAFEAIFHAFWVETQEAHKPDVLRRILGKALGADTADELAAAAATPEVKKALIRRTDEAFASGAFGLPWFVCTNGEGKRETFWGVDHLGQLAAFMELEKPPTMAWKALL